MPGLCRRRVRKGLEGANLVNQLGEQLRNRDFDFSSPEILAVLEARVCANGHALFSRRSNRLENRGGIAGVKPGGDVRRADQLKQLSVMTRPFTQVGVEVH